MNKTCLHLATTLGQLLSVQGARVTAAESCTGGGIAAAITAVPGSSGWFDAGFITYSNAAKTRLLKVGEGLLKAHGAVSPEVVAAMARGALAQAGADYAVAVSGIAGPGGGTAAKPVGTVWLAWCSRQGAEETTCFQFTGDREQVREQAVEQALAGLVAVSQKDVKPL